MAEMQWGPRVKNHHVRGNVGTAPELHTSQNGRETVRFRVAEEQYRFDRDSGQDVKDRTIWYTVKIPADRKLAQHVLASLNKGDVVNVTGTFQSLSAARVDEQGQAQTGLTNFLDANDVSPSLRLGVYRQLSDAEQRVLAEFNAKEQQAEGGLDYAGAGWEAPAAPKPTDLSGNPPWT